MYIYVYIHIYTHAYVYVYIYIYTHLYMYIYRERYREREIERDQCIDTCICVYIYTSLYIYIYICSIASVGVPAAVHVKLAHDGAHALAGQIVSSRQLAATANLRTKILNFRGFDSSIILILRGGILMSIENLPECLRQQTNLTRDNLSKGIGRRQPGS